MIAINKMLKFRPGTIVATPGSLEALERAKQTAWELLALHLSGDWGVVDEDDKVANDQSLMDGSRLLSAYILKTGEKVWIITEAEVCGHREATTILLPEEY